MVPTDVKVLYRLNPLLVDVLEAFATAEPTDQRAPDGRPYIDSAQVLEKFREERGVDCTEVIEHLFLRYQLLAWSGVRDEPLIHYFTLTGAGEALAAKIAGFRKMDPKEREKLDAQMRAAQPKYVTPAKPVQPAAAKVKG
mgnify:CR=1 FL=1